MCARLPVYIFFTHVYIFGILLLLLLSLLSLFSIPSGFLCYVAPFSSPYHLDHPT